MSHQPRRYFVVVLHNGIPRIIKGANGQRLVDGALEDVVCTGRPLLGWRTFAGADKRRYDSTTIGPMFDWHALLLPRGRRP